MRVALLLTLGGSHTSSVTFSNASCCNLDGEVEVHEPLACIASEECQCRHLHLPRDRG